MLRDEPEGLVVVAEVGARRLGGKIPRNAIRAILRSHAWIRAAIERLSAHHVNAAATDEAADKA